MGNPAAGVLVLLLALYLLLAYFSGRLEWLFRLGALAREPAGPGDPGNVSASVIHRPGTTWGGWRAVA